MSPNLDLFIKAAVFFPRTSTKISFQFRFFWTPPNKVLIKLAKGLALKKKWFSFQNKLFSAKLFDFRLFNFSIFLREKIFFYGLYFFSNSYISSL